MKNEQSMTDALTVCLGVLALPALQAWCVGLNSWVAHVIWQWYPPFGQKAPSVPELFVIFTLLRLTRGIDTDKKKETLGIWSTALALSAVSLILLASVAIMRWWIS